MNLKTVDEVLTHYGVRGMKWGVRKKSSGPSSPEPVIIKTKPGQPIKVKGAGGHPASPDAINAAVAKQKAHKSGPQALSNQEMRLLVDRMNLEQQYSRLNPKEASIGEKFIKQALEGPLAAIALEGVKANLKDNEDPRVQLGLQVAETIVTSRSGKKKKK